MASHHTLNLVLMIILITVNYFNALNLFVSITLTTLIIIKAVLLIKANSKQVKNNGLL